MRRFSTILLYVTIAFLLLWQLPWCYNFFVVKPEKTPFTLYSFVIGDFAQMGQEEGKGSVRRDLAGNIYSEAAFDSILPMFYFRQLMSDERFPDTIKGIAVTPKMVQTENFNFRSVPSDINAPSIGLCFRSFLHYPFSGIYFHKSLSGHLFDRMSFRLKFLQSLSPPFSPNG